MTSIASASSPSTPPFSRLLIANRGEIAIRIARAAAGMGITSVAIYSEEDARSLHRQRADESIALPGKGTAAYLDSEAVIQAARRADCDAIHPGYGFLSENAAFARRCAEEGICFVGPHPEALDLFGDKAAARRLAAKLALPLARGSTRAVTLAEARDFLASLEPGRQAMLKAVAGGGGRGMRVVESVDHLDAAYASAASEAYASFGVAALYIEEFISPARHVEVQILGDREGRITHLFDRECSLQRRHQKLVEVAPAFGLPDAVRGRIIEAAVKMARATRIHTLCTFEFLVDAEDPERFVFMEANPRLQVEHTVTEEVSGIDLVQTQILLAAGLSLEELNLTQDAVQPPQGHAVQVRINAESIGRDGRTLPASGMLTRFDLPTGAGIRIETCGYGGYAPPTCFDSLLAKLIVHVRRGTAADALAGASRALSEFRIQGLQTNLGFMRHLLHEKDVLAGQVDTRYVERHAARIAAGMECAARDDVTDATATPASAEAEVAAPAGTVPVCPEVGGQLVALKVRLGETVRAGQVIAIVEAMKMEYSITTDTGGLVVAWGREPGDSVTPGTPLIHVEPRQVLEQDNKAAFEEDEEAAQHVNNLRARRQALQDDGRPAAVASQRQRGAYTARERIRRLCDADSFHEIGGLVRNPALSKEAPADGLVAGSCRIDGRHAFVVAQDFTVFGGSSGNLGEAKLLRTVRLAAAQGLPLVMLLDGGGHRIQDGQSSREYAPATPLFQDLARISGWIPVVSAVMGFGFAANTNFSSMADLVIMVRGKSTMGLAGPALVKAGTGEQIDVERLGGAQVQVDQYGLADIGVETEDEALETIRRFLSFCPANARQPAPAAAAWQAPDPHALIGMVPANTRRAYDVRKVIDAIADKDGGFEIKPTFAANIVTHLARLGGRPVGFIANQPLVKSGMIDAAAAEKAARFIAFCDAFGLPLIYLVDIPGLSIGPTAEASMLGRRSAKMLFELAHATVPRLSVIMRKGYGLGYYAMCGGRSFDADACFAWPTAEICAMSVEGSVDVAFRKQYESAPEPARRRQELIDQIRTEIDPIKAAESFGIDDLIEPQETRERLLDVLARSPARHAVPQPPKFRSTIPI